MQEKKELELIDDFRRGDKAAVSELFARHYPSSLRLACVILRSEEDARDAVQSAFFSAFRHLYSFRGEASFKTWITRIVMNHSLMGLRASGRVNWIRLDDAGRNEGATALASPAPTPEMSTLCREIASELSDAMARLPRPLREVFTLHTVSGLSIDEVAAALGLTVRGAKTRLFRARSKIRPQLQRRLSLPPAQRYQRTRAA